MLRPTQSLSIYLQQVGRCLRPAKGKKYAIINDHVGNSVTHGLPNQERNWSLEGKKVREKVKAPPLKVCDACFAVNPVSAKECTDCGNPFKVRERRELARIDGDLVERIYKVGDDVQVYFKNNWRGKFKIMNKKDTLNGIVYSVKNKKSGNIFTDIPEHRMRPPLNQELYDCKTYEDLKALAAKRGYKQGWAYYRWQQRQNKRFY